MNELEHLEMRLVPELEVFNGILDRIDYGKVRRLGVQLREIPTPSNGWDIPPASLQGWVASFEASKEIISLSVESGIMQLLQENNNEIRNALSPRIIPAIDTEIVESKSIDEMITSVKEHDRVKEFTPEKFQALANSSDELARVLVVDLHDSVVWGARPRVSEATGLKRLRIGAMIGQATVGGALATGNIALGVLGGVITTITAIQGGNVAIAVGIAGSVYVGVNGVLKAVSDIADELKEKSESSIDTNAAPASGASKPIRE